MSDRSNGWSEKRSGLYTANDYIKDLLVVIENNKYCIKQMEDNNKDLVRKIEDLEIRNRKLISNSIQSKQTEACLREVVSGLKKYISRLEFSTRNEKTEEIAFCATEATEATDKCEVKPSVVVMKNTMSDKLFSVNCEARESDSPFISISELKAKTELPKKYAFMTIEWKILRPTLIAGHNKRLVDISKWKVKNNTIVNIIPIEGYPFRPNQNKVLKIAFDGMIDFESVERQAMDSLTDDEESKDEFEELINYFEYMKSYRPKDNSDSASTDSISDQKYAQNDLNGSIMEESPKTMSKIEPDKSSGDANFNYVGSTYWKAHNQMKGWTLGRGRAKPSTNVTDIGSQSPLPDFEDEIYSDD